MRKLAVALTILATSSVALVRCVGDSTTPTDGGNDVTTQPDTGTDVKGDAPPTDGGLDAEAEAAPPPPPTPDGGIVWLNHYNTNAQISDLSASDPQGNIVIVGSLRTCSGCASNVPDYQTHIGGFSLPSTPPSTRADALIAKLNSTGSAVWARSPATVASDAGLFANDDYITSVAVDSNGDIYIGGYTGSHSITLKNTLLGPCSFVAKLSSDGTTYLWDHAYTSTGAANTPHVSVQGTKLAVALAYSGTLSYDSGQNVTALGQDDAFAATLSATDGSTVWHQSFGGSQYDEVEDVALTPALDVVVSGYFGSTTMAGTGTGFPLNLIGTQSNGYLVKLAAADGKALYTLGYGDTTSTNSVDVTTVAWSNGMLAFGGYTYGTSVDFGKGPVGSTNGDGFVVMYDEGKKQAAWTSMLASDQYDTILGVAFDAWGYLVATGSYAGYQSTTAKLGSQTLPNSNYKTQPMLIAKWNPTGTLLWVDTYIPSLANGNPPYASPDGSAGYLWLNGSRVRTAANGTVYVSGGMSGSAIFGSTGYQTKLSTLGPEFFQICFNPPCPVYESPDGIIGAWLP